MKIKLTQGKYALIDNEDYEITHKYTWNYCSGRGPNNGYARSGTGQGRKGKKIYLHRLIMGAIDSPLQVDHINGDTLDNRKQNLRICTHKENLRNSKAHKKYKGICRNKKRFGSRICVEGITIYGGWFDTEIEAAASYNKLAIEYYGEYARLNNIEENTHGS